MARCLSQSFWVAIRPQSRSQLGRMNSTLYMYQSETSTTMFAARTEMELVFWHSFRFPKVSTTHVVNSSDSTLITSGLSKADRKYQDDDKFRMFRRQLFHTSITAILESLRPAMTTPEVTQCPDGHLRRVIYGIGPYIADYPEQALLACIVQGWCPK